LFIIVGVMILPLKDWLKALLLLATLFVGVLLYQHEANVKHHWLFSQTEKAQTEMLA
jgi:hypothetical protein